MRTLIRRILLTACCAWLVTECSGVDSERLYGEPYYGTEWYYGDNWYGWSGGDISLPDRPGRPGGPLRPEHPIELPPGETPPRPSQLPSGKDRPIARPSPAPAPRPTPSFSAPRPSIPSTPRAAPRGGGGGGRRR
ncbi:MAG: hypothetical protein ACM3TN_09280 [Alphaproteobacteria bacterium]